mmetsp:Transcript_41986/g.113225  ORF Transcript_41986/g.113225 Transcript_41986/m.113225 type:complete len:230 (-) Transcript_41986:1380-2069(-)
MGPVRQHLLEVGQVLVHLRAVRPVDVVLGLELDALGVVLQGLRPAARLARLGALRLRGLEPLLLLLPPLGLPGAGKLGLPLRGDPLPLLLGSDRILLLLLVLCLPLGLALALATLLLCLLLYLVEVLWLAHVAVAVALEAVEVDEGVRVLRPRGSNDLVLRSQIQPALLQRGLQLMLGGLSVGTAGIPRLEEPAPLDRVHGAEQPLGKLPVPILAGTILGLPLDALRDG